MGGSRALPVRPHYPVHYAPSAKMVPVSLARNGLPRFILRRHRNMVSQGKEVDRWVRIYVTLFDLHKLILVPAPVDVTSILEPLDGEAILRPIGPIGLEIQSSIMVT